MLSNSIYIGQVRHKKTCYPGQHEAIIEKELWDQVQQHMARNSEEHKTRSCTTVSCPLTNKLFDVSGERLIPVHVNKKGRRYRYYISQSLKADPRHASPNGWRLPGLEFEQVITYAALEIIHDEVAITTALQESGIVVQHIHSALDAAGKIQPDAADLIDRFIERVELRQDGIRLMLSLASLMAPKMDSHSITIVRDILMQMKQRGVEKRLIIGGSGPARVDQTLLKTIVRAHTWFNELVSGRVQTMAEIASREGVDKSYLSRVMSLAFLAPDITESIIAGRQPADLSVEKLTKRIDLPLDWMQQRQLLGYV